MSRRAILALSFVSSLVAASPRDARAQVWSADLSGGRTVYEPVAVNLGTNNLVGTVRYDALRGAWVYGTAALPLGGAAPFWDSAGTGGRFTLPGSSLRRANFGSDVGAHGFMFRDAAVQQMGSGGVLEAIPFANVSAGAANLELRGGWRGQSLSFAGVTQNRGVFETGIRAVYDASVNLQGDVRWVRATEGVFPFVGASIAYAGSSPIRVWGRAGKWVGNSALTNASWSFGASAAIGSRSNLWASAQQDAPDPLYWNAQRRSWAVGVTWRLNRSPAPLLPTPSAQPGGVLIRIAADDAPDGEIFIAGSFNNWQPQPMQREADFWTIRLPLAAGVYHYSFRSASGEWFVPASTPGRRDDGMGGHEAVLVVS
jgi:Glycogen recognition site of AMP-activated protein kinase